jgi:hypothetical protein
MGAFWDSAAAVVAARHAPGPLVRWEQQQQFRRLRSEFAQILELMGIPLPGIQILKKVPLRRLTRDKSLPVLVVK